MVWAPQREQGHWGTRSRSARSGHDHAAGAGGGTGGRGHRFGLSYVLVKNVIPALTYYHASYEGRNNNDSYERLQADIVVKF